MMQGKKKLFNVIYGRTIMVAISIIIQIFILFGWFQWLEQYSTYIFGGFTFLSAILILVIMNNKSNPAFKLAWIIPILVFPVFGGLIYLFVHFQSSPKRINKRLNQIFQYTDPILKQDMKVLDDLEKVNPQATNLARYLSDKGGYPTYENTQVEYFPLGEKKFVRMLEELERAEDFIFLEYFIVDEGYMWDSILEVLKRKVKEGVEVRFMYDGMCCMVLLPYSYPKQLEAMGIQCKMFSPIKPALSTAQNNRDHRKILVIDGKVAFNGGVNLADEYINHTVKYGHWKDTAVMLTGDAVKAFTIMFLQMWNITEKQPENYQKYVRMHPRQQLRPTRGFVTAYGDSPLDDENVGEFVYMDILATAKKYVHIMTPYLILDNEMITALCFAAKRGVDVKLILPHIPDKKSAFALAHSYYPRLLEAGVEIYEYTPGFVHAKVFTSDDEKAVVGTINMDFRSLYLHFECATYMYQCPVIHEIEMDFQETLLKCQKVTVLDYKEYSGFHKFSGVALKLFAPLM